MNFITNLYERLFEVSPNNDDSEMEGVFVYVEFKFKSGEKYKFLDILKGPEGLCVTRTFPGCISIEYFDNIDDDNTIILWQKWKHRSDHEAYLKKRTDEGMMDFLKDLLEYPLKPVYMKCDTFI